jgi:hypothetical protein
MAVKIYIVKIYDPLRQCSSSKVVAVWCEKADDSGKRRRELKGRRVKNKATETSSRRKMFTHERCKKFFVKRTEMKIWKIG